MEMGPKVVAKAGRPEARRRSAMIGKGKTNLLGLKA
jgi:hypothetical protein